MIQRDSEVSNELAEKREKLRMPTLAIGRLDSDESSNEHAQKKPGSADSVSVDYERNGDEQEDSYNYAFKPKKNQKMSSFGKSRRRFEDKRSNTIFMPPYADIGKYNLKTLQFMNFVCHNSKYRHRKT